MPSTRQQRRLVRSRPPRRAPASGPASAARCAISIGARCGFAYGELFALPHPVGAGDLFASLNPDSETVLGGCLVEPALVDLPVGQTVQFERLGYFCADPDSTPGHPIFNRTLTLRDAWAKARREIESSSRSALRRVA
jgi:hypothetical protein